MMNDIIGTEYVHRDYWGYYLQKQVNGKVKRLGYHKTLIGILMMRDWCEANGWEKYPKTPKKHKSKYKKVARFIYKYTGNTKISYNIRKRIGKKTVGYGAYKTLENALVMRDVLEANGWQKLPEKPLRNIAKTDSGKYMVFKTVVGDNEAERLSFGVFDCLTDAMDERDKLVECDWDLDAWCDLR